MSKLFESNWGATKEALCEGLDGNKKAVMETVLENTKRELALMENATTGATAAGNACHTHKPRQCSRKIHKVRNRY